MPLLGEFDFRDGEVVFLGKITDLDGKAVPTIGNALSNQRFSGGTIEATVIFDEISDRSAAELILSYDPMTRGFLVAGIGGAGASMFDIREFRPEGAESRWGWNAYAMAGERVNLRAKQEYQVKASVMGSFVSLSVDDVNVLTTTLDYPLQETQVGIWCMGEHQMHIRDFKVMPAEPRAFIIMEFSSPFNEIYADVIKKTCENNGLKAINANEIYGPGLIVSDVVQEILSAKVIIADITPLNANVFFEVGYAFAENKPTILLAEKQTTLPFDLSPFRVLFYENSIAGKAKVEHALEKHLKSIIGNQLDGV